MVDAIKKYRSHIVLLFAVAFIAIGIVRSEHLEVLRKAINI